MKKTKSLLGMILSVCLLISIFNLEVYAASGSLILSNPSGNVGSTVTVTGTIQASEAISAATVVLTYKQSELTYVDGNSGVTGGSVTGGSGSVRFFCDVMGQNKSTITFTMRFTILKQVTSKLESSTIEVCTDGDQPQYIDMSVSGGSITGKVSTTSNTNNNSNNNTNNNNTTQNTKDSNNKLNSLQVYPGTLSPAFSADTAAYNVTVPEETTSVTISAVPQSSKATVTVSGGTDLKLGENTAQVVVVAENGSSRAYTITIICGDKEQIQVGNKNYTIYEDFTDDQIPTGFSRTKLTYNNRQYEALTNATNTVQLLSLQNDAGATYYIYNQETQEFYTFVQISIAEGKYIIPLPLSNKIEEFAKAETVSLNVQEKNFDAWKIDEEFSVVYAINQDGAEVLYRYDSVDGIFQRYTDAAIEVDETDTKKALFPNTYYMYAIVGLLGLVLILFIAMIYFIASRKHRHEGRKRRVIRQQEKLLAKEERRREKEERTAEKQRAIDEKQRLKEEKKLAKQKKKEK